MEKSDVAKWYAVHTYSGYEKKVKDDIKMTIENRNMQDKILDVVVPEYDEEEMTEKGRKVFKKKLFPGYVFLNMIMNEDTWYIVRNTRGVTGFVGPGSNPEPLSDAEVIRINNMTSNAPIFEVGDKLEVISGVWAGNTGIVKAVSDSKKEVTISIDNLTITLGFDCVKKAE